MVQCPRNPEKEAANVCYPVWDVLHYLVDKVERYEEKTRQLCCFRGIVAHTVLSILVEIGDFIRFPTAQHFASFLGLTPALFGR